MVSSLKKSRGKISINIYKKDQDFFIDIEDNGIGMSEEEISEILDTKKQKEETVLKIGVNNINNRIKLNFGDEYGVKISSEIGTGTKVVLKLPLIEKGGRDND